MGWGGHQVGCGVEEGVEQVGLAPSAGETGGELRIRAPQQLLRSQGRRLWAGSHMRGDTCQEGGEKHPEP